MTGGARPTLDLTVLPDALAVCRLPAGAASPPWLAGEPFASVTRTPEETSIVCRAEIVPLNVRVETGWRALRVAGPLDFALTGILLSLLEPLAAAGVSAFALSTFDTDVVLVREAALDDALAALGAAGHRIARGGAGVGTLGGR
ncbi:MAG: ACT domain-containing protein [Trueperaceae bacterium]|nr:ACT domain-containing protein [Trueperaceae bacterium]